MQTQTKPSNRIADLQRQAAGVRDEIIDLEIELSETPDPRDADGCRCSDERFDICDRLDQLEATLKELEEQIDEAKFRALSA